MSFVGSNPHPQIAAQDPQPGVSNYFIGSDPEAWLRDVPGYSKIYYRNLWPGIDMVLYDASGVIGYDFEIAPGADPSRIKLAFEGAETVDISDQGELVVSAPAGGLTHTPPYVFQTSGDGKEEVPARFVIEEGGVAGFEVGDYDTTRPLVIDPAVLAYSTYLGGSGDEVGAVAVDPTGAIYVSGWTTSPDFPLLNPYQSSPAGSEDLFVTKLTADGATLVYSTYLGGSGSDLAEDVVVDSSGAIYLTGETRSSDYPTKNAYQPTLRGTADVYVTKVAPSGSDLVWSTYLGGAGPDWGESIALDAGNSVYLTGNTASSDFPTANAFQPTLRGTQDAFVTKFASNGAGLVYSTYLGGSGTGSEKGEGIAVDITGSAFVSGTTRSSDFPIRNALQPTPGGGADVFVAKVDPAGSSLAYSTYLGGSANDEAESLAIDQTGAAYVVGETRSTDFPISGVPFQPSYAGGIFDAYVAKISPLGTSLVYSTYLGGLGLDWAEGVAVDVTGSAYVIGLTDSLDFPVQQAFQPTRGGSFDAFVTKVDPTGSSLAYSSYLGGDMADIGFVRASIDSSGAVYFAGNTSSSNFPTAGSPYQSSYGGGGADAFAAKVLPPAPPATLSGTFIGGIGGGISVYGASSGELIAYYCCLTSETWSIQVPESTCPGGGYKIVFIPGTAAQRLLWYNTRYSWQLADCVSAPSSGINMDVQATPATLTGYVKDAGDAADINGATIYAFRSDGAFSGWAVSGRDGPGRYRLDLGSEESYKLFAVGPPALEDIWFDGAAGFSEATALVPPAQADFSLRQAGTITGRLTQNGLPLAGGYVSAYTTCGCTTPKGAISDASGNYSIKVASTGASGWEYRIRAIPPSGQTRWYLDATGFGGATNVSAPASGIDLELPP